MGSLGSVHGIPDYTMVQMGWDGYCELHNIMYMLCILNMGSLGSVHGILDYTTVQMGWDGHHGLHNMYT